MQDVSVETLSDIAPLTSTSYAAVNAVPLAVEGGSECRLSSPDNTRWAKWAMPAGRSLTTWWKHAAGQSAVEGATGEREIGDLSPNNQRQRRTCYTYCTPCRPLIRAFSGWILTPPPSAGETTTVTNQASATATCYQNPYGIMKSSGHGGSFPAITVNDEGNTGNNDLCMAVGVLASGSSANGWSQSGNGYDVPPDTASWPPGAYSYGSEPEVMVWIR